MQTTSSPKRLKDDFSVPYLKQIPELGELTSGRRLKSAVSRPKTGRYREISKNAKQFSKA